MSTVRKIWIPERGCIEITDGNDNDAFDGGEKVVFMPDFGGSESDEKEVKKVFAELGLGGLSTGFSLKGLEEYTGHIKEAYDQEQADEYRYAGRSLDEAQKSAEKHNLDLRPIEALSKSFYKSAYRETIKKLEESLKNFGTYEIDAELEAFISRWGTYERKAVLVWDGILGAFIDFFDYNAVSAIYIEELIQRDKARRLSYDSLTKHTSAEDPVRLLEECGRYAKEAGIYDGEEGEMARIESLRDAAVSKKTLSDLYKVEKQVVEGNPTGIKAKLSKITVEELNVGIKIVRDDNGESGFSTYIEIAPIKEALLKAAYLNGIDAMIIDAWKLANTGGDVFRMELWLDMACSYAQEAGYELSGEEIGFLGEMRKLAYSRSGIYEKIVEDLPIIAVRGELGKFEELAQKLEKAAKAGGKEYPEEDIKRWRAVAARKYAEVSLAVAEEALDKNDKKSALEYVGNARITMAKHEIGDFRLDTRISAIVNRINEDVLAMISDLEDKAGQVSPQELKQKIDAVSKLAAERKMRMDKGWDEKLIARNIEANEKKTKDFIASNRFDEAVKSIETIAGFYRQHLGKEYDSEKFYFMLFERYAQISDPKEFASKIYEIERMAENMGISLEGGWQDRLRKINCEACLARVKRWLDADRFNDARDYLFALEDVYFMDFGADISKLKALVLRYTSLS